MTKLAMYGKNCGKFRDMPNGVQNSLMPNGAQNSLHIVFKTRIILT